MPLPHLDASSCPLQDQQLTGLRQAMRDMTPAQAAWVSGYLAGVSGLPAPAAAASRPSAKLTVLYGSQTGNARGVAERLVDEALAQGLEVELASTAEFKPREISKIKLLLLVVSTQGEGEPPESAFALHRYLGAERAPRLGQLSYAVFGLGDSSYAHFNQAARDFDEQLAKCGANRLLARVDADLEFAPAAAAWSRQALQRAAERLPEKNARVLALPGVELNTHQRPTREQPFRATLLEQRRITTDDAVADVRHLALSVDPAQLLYTPGDALGVWFANDPALVDATLAAVGLPGDTVVTVGGEPLSLRQALGEKLELTQLHPSVVAAWAEFAAAPGLTELLNDQTRKRRYIAQHQVLDLLRTFPAQPTAAQLLELLRPMQPRLYSIASSQDETADEVHLTVALRRDAERLGGASGFLTQRLREGDPLDVYVVENSAFRLPRDGDTPIILIGAGTGAAPYRSFLQHRAMHGHRGESWLIFGNRHYHRDFLYQLDWRSFRKAGCLNRTHVAFSRDQAGRVYVQDRVREHGREIYRWLEEGAHLYVCGSTVMGRAVQQALLKIAATHGGLDAVAAEAYIDELRRDGRYQRDTY